MRPTILTTALGGVLATGGLLGIDAPPAAAQGDSYGPRRPYHQPPAHGHIDPRPRPVHQPRGHVDVRHGYGYQPAPAHAQPYYQPATVHGHQHRHSYHQPPARIDPPRVRPHGDYIDVRPGRVHRPRGNGHHDDVDGGDH